MRGPVRRLGRKGGGAADQRPGGAVSPREESRGRSLDFVTPERWKTGKPTNGKPGGPKPTRPYTFRGKTLKDDPTP